MTEKQIKAKELAELLNAFAERKQLQFLNDEGHWVKCVKGTLKVFFNGVEVASEEGEYNGI